MNKTPNSARLHIGIFGRCNVGKSKLLNAITAQDAALVSDIKGTTTDPVYKSMELLPLGPVVFIDTAGLDDATIIGKERINRTYDILRKTDIAVLVIDSDGLLTSEELHIIKLFKEKNIPYIVAQNKGDLISTKNPLADILVSALKGSGIEKLKETIINAAPKGNKATLLDDIVSNGDSVVLVTPIDKGAPKGRIILPQQQVLRELLDSHCTAIVTQPEELGSVLLSLKAPPSLVITDSQVFSKVSGILPLDIPLTSFSILFARLKGILKQSVSAVNIIEALKDNDNILIAEGCSHHRQCEDIGTVKIPGWLLDHTGKKLNFSFVSGGDFPANLLDYSLIIHCGGCMLNNKEMQYRLLKAEKDGIPITNYGILISYLQNTLQRSISMFGGF